MVGAVIVTHAHIGERLIDTAEFLVGKTDGITAVSVDLKTNAFEARMRIAEAAKQVDQGQGVLILTDFFGGSPANIALSFLKPGRVDVLTGVNLPMIITFLNKRKGMTLLELAKSIKLSGVRSIARARNLTETQGAFERVGREFTRSQKQ